MSDIHQFLAWFSGFAENINKQPTPDQWKRVKDRIASLEGAARIQPMGVSSTVAASVPPAAKPEKPQTKKQWLLQYEAALVAFGLDEESAAMFAAEATVDMTADPAASAKQQVGPMLAN